MAIRARDRFGPYEIVSAIGAGGMGEVYRAEDTRLGRSVALKVLPEGFAGDPDRKARFEREARAVSQLSHPNICGLYDVGQENGIHFLVLEYCEGATLADRLEQGPMSIGEVFRHGAEIANALAAAHRGGVVHRDLKPSNVILTREGAKLLDFGLAQLGAETTEEVADELTHLTTMKNRPLTEEGAILGTFQYMSPEQLQGQRADERSDVFALGALLFEMATGQRAFAAESRASLIAAILERTPAPVSRDQPLVPYELDHLVARCLEKEPDQRWQSARDVALELEWIAKGAPRATEAGRAAEERNKGYLPWLVAAVLLIAVGGHWLLDHRGGESSAATPSRGISKFLLPPPEGRTFASIPAISPDGKFIAFTADPGIGDATLWLRPLASLEARELGGTGNATHPFFSPDGRSIGFFADDEVKRVDLDGSVRSLAAGGGIPRGGTWGSTGTILYAIEPATHLFAIDPTGGTPREVPGLTGPGAEDAVVFWPSFLPDGDHFLFAASGPAGSGLFLGSLSSDERRQILAAGDINDLTRSFVDPEGFLLTVEEGSLVARPFDLESLVVTDRPFVVENDIDKGGPGASDLAISSNGTLVFAREIGEVRTEFVAVSRDGTVFESPVPTAAWSSMAIAPDGRRVAFDRGVEGESRSVWVADLVTGALTRITGGAKDALRPVWSRDGTRLAVALADELPPNLFVASADGVDEPTRLTESRFAQFPTDWSPGGGSILFSSRDGGDEHRSISIVELDGRTVRPLIREQGSSFDASLSPEGDWLLFDADKTGEPHVYLSVFPELGRRWQVSHQPASRPAWRGDGREIYFEVDDDGVYAVEVQLNAEPVLSRPERIFGLDDFGPDRGVFDWAPGPDGERFFLLLRPRASNPLTVVLDWRSLGGG